MMTTKAAPGSSGSAWKNDCRALTPPAEAPMPTTTRFRPSPFGSSPLSCWSLMAIGAPPFSHLLVDGDAWRLGQGSRENNTRPAIDPLFRSVALCCGSRAVGAVLTGTLGDGASGLHTLHEYGGLTVVQDPDDAAFAGM